MRDAFAALGHDAWSCDLLPSERRGKHFRCDLRELLGPGHGWDLLIAHPPCTYLAVSGARHFEDPDRRAKQAEALDFVRAILAAPVPSIAVENPVSVISTAIRKPDQYVHPWMFGHGETKKTALWLKGLYPLKATQIVAGRRPRVHNAPGGNGRGLERSRTYPGLAAAMAAQWGLELPIITDAQLRRKSR